MYTELIKNIKPVTGIETITFGDVYNNWNNSEIKYSALNVFCTDCTVNDGSISYQLMLFVADRLLDDKSNEAYLYDVATLQLEAIIDNLDGVVTDRKYTFFSEKFADQLAGAFAEITIELPYIKHCNNL